MGIPEPDPDFATRTRPDPNKYGSGMGMHNMGRVENGLTRTRSDPTRLPGLPLAVFG